MIAADSLRSAVPDRPALADIDADLRVRDRAVYLSTADALVVADLHVGMDADSAVELSLGERTKLPARIDALLAAFDPETVVIAGDVLHAFDRIPTGADRTLSAIREHARDRGATLAVLSGNHDPMLETVYDGSIDRERRLADGTVVCHGDVEPEATADRYVIGHAHPAIVLEGQRRPCYLYGERSYRGSDVLVLPAFNRLTRGTPVNGLRAPDANSPILRAGSLDEYRPIVLDDSDPLVFPPLGTFRELL